MDDTTGRMNESDRPSDEKMMSGAEPGSLSPDAQRRTREIQNEIEQTREDMAETLDAIQDRLRPGTIVAHATERVKAATTERVRVMADTASDAAQNVVDRTRDTAGSFIDTIRDNPIPSALIAVGAAWLVMNTSNRNTNSWNSDPQARWRSEYDRDRGYSTYGDNQPSQLEGVQQRAREYVSEASDKIRRGTRRTQNRLERMMTENPLLVGAGALMLGAAFGMAVPETETENEWMGDARDSVVEGAQQMASNAASAIQEKASNVANAAGNVADTIAGKQQG